MLCLSVCTAFLFISLPLPSSALLHILLMLTMIAAHHYHYFHYGARLRLLLAGAENGFYVYRHGCQASAYIHLYAANGCSIGTHTHTHTSVHTRGVPSIKWNLIVTHAAADVEWLYCSTVQCTRPPFWPTSRVMWVLHCTIYREKAVLHSARTYRAQKHYNLE